MKRHIIWSEDIDIKDWIDDDGNVMTFEEADELNREYLDDERCNLDIATEGEIICIGSLGLWNGTREGYQLIGHNIKNVLWARVNGMSINEWYVDDKDVCQDEAHHDGCNHYIYRILKGKTHDEQIANAEKLYSKPLTRQRIGIYTKSLRQNVADVYGWR